MKKKEQKIKQQVINGLKGKRWLKCPKCKHGYFIRKEFTKVQILDDGDKNLTDHEVDVLFDNYEYRCAKCDEDVLVEDMI